MQNGLIQQFVNSTFGSVRSIIINGEPWFVGSDVARCLGYKDTDQALRQHIYDHYKLTRQFNGSGQNRDMIIINEAGLYQLIFTSKLPSAKIFANWVYSEVLPTMRKIGFDRSMEILQQEVSRLQNENEMLNIENDSLRNDNANLVESKYENSDLRNRIEGYGCIIQDMQETIEELKREKKENENE